MFGCNNTSIYALNALKENLIFFQTPPADPTLDERWVFRLVVGQCQTLLNPL